jgi:protein SCO1/2
VKTIGAVALALLVAAAASAQSQQPPRGILQGVGFDQNLDASLPLGLAFRDENGKAVRLGDYFGRRPVILSFVYFKCPMLCSYVEDGLVRALRALRFSAGREFDVLTVSFDPSDTPSLALVNKNTYLSRYRRAGAEGGWHFLTGDAESIAALTKAAGFRYELDRQSGQYAHAAGIMVVTPGGRVARYFYGVEYSARDLRLALVESSQGKIGTPVDQVLLYCCQYDPSTGKYGLIITRVLRLAGGLTVLLLGGFVGVALWRERHRPVNHLRPL